MRWSNAETREKDDWPLEFVAFATLLGLQPSGQVIQLDETFIRTNPPTRFAPLMIFGESTSVRKMIS
jgi:hypothetical protein